MARVIVENLVKRFGTVGAVNGVSFVAEEGQVFSLLGPSGCGKTTTLRCIAGLEHPDEGRITIGDETVFDAQRKILVPSEKRTIGMVFQSFAIWPHLTVYENVAFPLRLRRMSGRDIEQSVREALRSVRMEGYERRYPGQLSGGQQQRVVLARCLVYRPRVILLDEPLANLDAKLREEMRAELRDVQQAFKITTIYVTHDQAEAMALSDQIAVMHEGAILRQGPPREVFSRPEHPFVADFVGASNLFAGHVAGRDGEGPVQVDVEGWGMLWVAAPANATAPIGPTTVSIRPGDLLLAQGNAEVPTNAWPGVVERVVYLGETIDCWVRVEDITLRIRTSADGNLQSGDRVTVGVHPAKISLLQASGARG